MNMNMLYRAYRIPYEWVPQLEPPAEAPVERIDIKQFRLPGAAPPGELAVVEMKGVRPSNRIDTACVLPSDRETKGRHTHENTADYPGFVIFWWRRNSDLSAFYRNRLRTLQDHQTLHAGAQYRL
jgi:hypothetical protein